MVIGYCFVCIVNDELLLLHFSLFTLTLFIVYDQQILQILSIVDERGISVYSLAKHIYNQNSTFFTQPDLQEIHQYVQQYLLRNSKSSQSLIESTGRRGYYRLNTRGSQDARQLMLNFCEQDIEETVSEKPQQTDQSLFLFEDF